mmetsp:Transcript_24825/g.52883  ORF Transcript_24825/g.52883 Transcript_24825/m.52883 type:complete len:333 (+) Transcript_24825:142-1140(+)
MPSSHCCFEAGVSSSDRNRGERGTYPVQQREKENTLVGLLLLLLWSARSFAPHRTESLEIVRLPSPAAAAQVRTRSAASGSLVVSVLGTAALRGALPGTRFSSGAALGPVLAGLRPARSEEAVLVFPAARRAAAGTGTARSAGVLPVVSSVVVQQPPALGTPGFAVPGAAGHGKGQEGRHKDDETKGHKDVRQQPGEFRFLGHGTGRGGLDLDRAVEGLEGLPVHLVPDRDTQDGPLGVSQRDAIGFAGEGIVGIKLPALVDQVVVVHAVVANDVSVLVGGVIDAARAVHVLLVDLVELREGVLLGVVPPIVGPGIAVVVGGVLASEVDVVL